MIGRLKGTLLHKQAPALLLDVNGVGYELEAPMTTFYELPAVGSEVILHTHFVVREDAQLLYGFAREDDRRLFRALIKVSGVGPKLALALLSGMSAEEFVGCVQSDDSAALTRVPGVGKKTAERLLVEMRDRVKEWQGEAPALGSAESSPAAHPDASREALGALIALGYKPPEASRMVSAVAGEGLASEEIIRAALRAAAP